MSNNMIKTTFFIFFFFFFISYYDLPNISMLRYAGMMLIAAAAYIVMLTDTKNYVWKGINKRPVLLLINFILLFCMMFMVFFAGDQVTAMLKIISMIILFVLTFIMIPPLIHKIGVVSFNKTIVISAFVAIAVAYFIEPNGYSYTGGVRIGVEERLKLLFNHPNTLGSMCFLGIVLTMYNYQKKDIVTVSSKIFYASLVIFFLVLLYQSDSRTSIYALITFAGLFFYKNIVKNKGLKLLTGISLGILFLAAIVQVIDLVDYDTLNLLLSYRLDYWFLALDHMIAQGSILVGEGSYARGGVEVLGGIVLDSSYVYILYHSGLIPLIFLCSLLVYLFVAIKKTKERKDKIFIESFFIAVLVISLFENILFNLSIVYSTIFFSYVYYFLRFSISEIDYK